MECSDAINIHVEIRMLNSFVDAILRWNKYERAYVSPI